MNAVAVTKRIDASADAVWAIIRTGTGVDRWAPMITSCRLEGVGAGAKRTCVFNDGSSDHDLHETILTIDDTSRLFQYRIDRLTIMPIRNVIGTMHVTEVGVGQCEVLWFANFDLDDESAAGDVKIGIESVYSAGIDGLEASARAT